METWVLRCKLYPKQRRGETYGLPDRFMEAAGTREQLRVQIDGCQDRTRLTGPCCNTKRPIRKDWSFLDSIERNVYFGVGFSGC